MCNVKNKEDSQFPLQLPIFPKPLGIRGTSWSNKQDQSRDGDTLVVTRMDRLGRNTVQLLQLIEELAAKNVHLVVMDLNIDTRTHTGKFFLTVMAGFSELERSIIKEKQRAGVELAKKAGKYKGRPTKFTERNPKLLHAVELYQQGKTVKEITAITGIGRTTLYRKLQEMNIERTVELAQ